MDPLTKRDDQTLQTLGSLLQKDLRTGVNFSLNNEFDNPGLQAVIRNTFGQLNQDELTRDNLFELFNDKSKVDHGHPFMIRTLQMLNSYVFRGMSKRVEFESTPAHDFD